MLQARKAIGEEPPAGEVVAFPLKARAPEFGRKAERPPFSLVVDLAAEDMGPRWFRGAATLAVLCASAILLIPGFDPLSSEPPKGPAHVRNAALSELALAPLGSEPKAEAMPQPRGALAGVRGNLKRVSGDVRDGLYWSLRASGASPQIAAAYLKAIATRIDVGEVAPFDRFEFVLAEPGPGEEALLYAGLQRAIGDDVQVMRWTAGGRTEWMAGDGGAQTSSGLMAPVAGRITSGFGSRVHPILRFSRFHAGIDFGAAWGSPIAAAADGVVVGTGWAGGYGKQVRIAHEGGLMTTYSHMSGIAAAPGTPVRQGQVIGYVGSTGLSTGPHLHFEVRAGGRPVNPLTARLVSRPVMDKAQIAAFKARLKDLLSIPVKPVGRTAES